MNTTDPFLNSGLRILRVPLARQAIKRTCERNNKGNESGQWRTAEASIQDGANMVALVYSNRNSAYIASHRALVMVLGIIKNIIHNQKLYATSTARKSISCYRTNPFRRPFSV